MALLWYYLLEYSVAYCDHLNKFKVNTEQKCNCLSSLVVISIIIIIIIIIFKGVA